VLTTILVATTACTIYSAALFTNLAMELLGPRGVRACVPKGRGVFSIYTAPPPKKNPQTKKINTHPFF